MLRAQRVDDGAHVVTLEQMCELPPEVTDVAAELQGADVVLTWDHSNDADFDREYWVASRAAGSQDWQIVERFELPAGSEPRHVLEGQAPTAPSEYTLDEVNGCVASGDQVCAENPGCAIATLAPREGS